MPAWLLAVPGKVCAWAAAVGAAIVGALVLYTTIRQGGRDAQAADQMRHTVENARARIEEDAAAARADDPAGRLRDRWGR